MPCTPRAPAPLLSRARAVAAGNGCWGLHWAQVHGHWWSAGHAAERVSSEWAGVYLSAVCVSSWPSVYARLCLYASVLMRVCTAVEYLCVLSASLELSLMILRLRDGSSSQGRRELGPPGRGGRACTPPLLALGGYSAQRPASRSYTWEPSPTIPRSVSSTEARRARGQAAQPPQTLGRPPCPCAHITETLGPLGSLVHKLYTKLGKKVGNFHRFSNHPGLEPLDCFMSYSSLS